MYRHILPCQSWLILLARVAGVIYAIYYFHYSHSSGKSCSGVSQCDRRQAKYTNCLCRLKLYFRICQHEFQLLFTRYGIADRHQDVDSRRECCDPLRHHCTGEWTCLAVGICRSVTVNTVLHAGIEERPAVLGDT